MIVKVVKAERSHRRFQKAIARRGGAEKRRETWVVMVAS
jgi:hypothetical protein